MFIYTYNENGDSLLWSELSFVVQMVRWTCCSLLDNKSTTGCFLSSPAAMFWQKFMTPPRNGALAVFLFTVRAALHPWHAISRCLFPAAHSCSECRMFFTARLVLYVLLLSAPCRISTRQVLSPNGLKWECECTHVPAAALVCRTYLCFWDFSVPVSMCVCVSSGAHCEGVIVKPRACKLSDSERCCTSKGHAF